MALHTLLAALWVAKCLCSLDGVEVVAVAVVVEEFASELSCDASCFEYANSNWVDSRNLVHTRNNKMGGCHPIPRCWLIGRFVPC